MVPITSGVVLLSLVSVVISSPLSAGLSINLRINRYNPVRQIMDRLCTSFESSFCKGSISPATSNHIIPETSLQTQRSIPAICEPSNFMDYRNFVDSRPFHSLSEPGRSKQECCLTCYDAGNCLSWVFNPMSLQCNYYTATTEGEDGSHSDTCPLGVSSGSYEEKPGYPVTTSNKFGHNYGPCLGDAPLKQQKAHVKGGSQETTVRKEAVAPDNLNLRPQVHDL